MPVTFWRFASTCSVRPHFSRAVKESAGNHDTKDFNLSEQVDKKEERRKKAAGGGKGGGGTQGREGKTKATKKKTGGNKRGGRRDSYPDSDEDEPQFLSSKKNNAVKSHKHTHDAFVFMDVPMVEAALRDVTILQEAYDELFEALAIQIHPTLAKLYNETVSELYRSSLTASLQNKRKSHVEFQEKTSALVESIRLFEKGLSSFSDPNGKNNELCKSFLRQVIIHIRNEYLKYK